MSVPNTFASATGSIPLSNLDANFAYYDAAYQIIGTAMSVNYTFNLKDVTDATKIAQFDVSGITTGTTRTYTLPNVTGTLATLGNISQTFAGAVTVSGAATFSSAILATAPTTVNASTHTVAATAFSLIFTTTNCTVTLPTASSNSGRVLMIKNITANSVVSASSNVVPLGSATAGTAILAATAGKFAMLQSNGTNWVVMMAN